MGRIIELKGTYLRVDQVIAFKACDSSACPGTNKNIYDGFNTTYTVASDYLIFINMINNNQYIVNCEDSEDLEKTLDLIIKEVNNVVNWSDYYGKKERVKL